MRKKRKENRADKARNVFSKALIIIGILGLCYPFAARQWNAYRQSKLAADYDRKAAANVDVSAEIARARQYNAKLYDIGLNNIPALEDEKSKEYESLLNPQGNGMMGYVEIPKIRVTIPIYHYSDEEQLSEGAGHLHGSSLPVGGKNTHAVITGHRGLPSNKMLTDLDQMKKGDHFAIHVLNQTFTYKVDQIRTVLPDEMDDLAIVPGEDHVTLITCTPYGVNSHRLLVRGIRTKEKADDKPVPVISKDTLRSSEWPAYACFALAMLIVAVSIIKTIWRKTHENRK